MTKRLLLAAALSISLAACGGGGGSGGSSGGKSAASTAGLAGEFATEIGKIKDCYQGEVDKKGDCSTDLLTDPVTRMCSDVRTGKPNPQFPGADFTKFVKTCDDWKSVLGLDAAGKVTLLNNMVTEVSAIK